MNRIAIIGSPGSGKSTLALKLSEILHIPVVHLDQLFWSPNWEPVDRPVFIDRLSHAMKERRLRGAGASVILYQYYDTLTPACLAVPPR